MTDLLRQRIQHARLTRRGFTAGAAALAATPLLRSGAFAQDATPVAMEAGGEDQLEIFSWWTAAGEAEGLEQLFNAFSASNPNASSAELTPTTL